MDTFTYLRGQADREVVNGMSGDVGGSEPNPEVMEQGTRRRFSTEYKLRILREADACKKHGELGQLLRREGLHSSHLSTWRRQQYDLEKYGAVVRSGSRKAAELRVKQLERENARLKKKLERAEAIVQIQKKASELLGIPLSHLDSDEND
jgi:transposase-like protein